MNKVAFDIDGPTAHKYLSGSCHIFAVAMHRKFNWPILVILDADDIFWQHPDDSDNYINSASHVYCLDQNNNAWDILGSRPTDSVENEVTDDIGIGSYSTVILNSEDELRNFVGDWSDDPELEVYRPLAEYDEADINEAMEVLNRLDFSPLPSSMTMT